MLKFDRYKTCHAYIRTTGNRKYGHMEVFIYNIIDDEYGLIRKPYLHVYSQIGSPDYPEQRTQLYATRYGIHGGEDQLGLRDLEDAVKYMRKFERRMEKMKPINSDESFAELCHRVIACSGAEYAFVNPHHNTGYDRMESLPHFVIGSVAGRCDLLGSLRKCESNIIQLYSQQAA